MLNHDPFWYIINPEQHAQVLDQDRIDGMWRAQQTGWHDLLDLLPEWGSIVHFEPGTRNVTRKSAQDAWRDVLPHDSRNTLDAHVQRLQALGVMRRVGHGIYRVSFAHGGAAILWGGQVLPALLKRTPGKGQEALLFDAAKEFAKTVEDTEEPPKGTMFGIKPFVPNKGGQGRSSPAYQTAFDLWRFCVHNAQLWEQVVGIAWMAPAVGKTAGIKDWVRDHGTRRGNDALQEFMELGRACGLFWPTGDRKTDGTMPGYAPVVNRLMWELLPGTVTSVAQAIELAGPMKADFELGFHDGPSGIIAEAWRAHMFWKFVPNSAPPGNGPPGVFIDPRSPGPNLDAVGCPLPAAFGQSSPWPAGHRLSYEEAVWWSRLIGRVEKVLEAKPAWDEGIALPLPLELPIKRELPAIRWGLPDHQSVAQLGIAIANYDVETAMTAILLPVWDVPGRDVNGPPHRVELWIVTDAALQRFSGDMKTIDGRAVPQRWLPMPPHDEPRLDLDWLRGTVRLLQKVEDRRQARDKIAKADSDQAPVPKP